MKICVDFSFILVFIYLSLYTGSLSNPFLITLLTLSQISFYHSSNSSFFIKKDIYLVLTKSLLYALIFGSIMHKCLTLLPSSYPSDKIFKTFFTKRNPVRHYYFTNVYIISLNYAFLLVKFAFFNFSMAKCYNFFTQFIYGKKVFIIFFIFIYF